MRRHRRADAQYWIVAGSLEHDEIQLLCSPMADDMIA
jgi:hypothetical protein